MRHLVVGISGASGIVLAHRAIDLLTRLNFHIDLVFSPAALLTASLEMGKSFATTKGFVASFSQKQQANITVHRWNNVAARIASGSYKTEGMLILPCSMATLAAVALGFSDNLLRRAADVALKERRKLVLVPREAPLTEIHLQHMLQMTKMGAIIVPPVPSWYTRPKTLEDVENFIVGKALDAFGIEHSLYPPWE